ncbi:MAG TPA: gliding motility-associated protein GldE [Bacteroidetes bacterium]|nr:gliding motility-associated protein GldE [Bacteroidota bacterium]
MEADDPLPYVSFLADLNIRFYQAGPSLFLGLGVLILLLACSAMISASETAYLSLTSPDLQKIRNGKSHSHQILLKLHEMPERLLTTILIVNNLFNVSIVVLAVFLLHSTLQPTGYPVATLLIEMLVIAFFLIVFAEILPKIYAGSHTVRISLLMAIPLFYMERFFRPLSRLLIFSGHFFTRRNLPTNSNISMDDLSEVLSKTSPDLREDEKMLQGIVNFGNISVSEIMTARVDVVAVDISTGLKKLFQIIVESGYSRIPVYKESFDNVKGILYIKDLLPYINYPDDFKWQDLIRLPYFVPETKRINDLLAEFQSKKIHMAIVIDEYGGTQGIVSLEDILEEIVGEISDEFDEDESTYTRIDENNYIFEGKTQLNDFYKIMGVSPDVFDKVKGDADTLAGLILEIRGEIPGKDEIIKIGEYIFRIESVDKRRIRKIKVTVNESE